MTRDELFQLHKDLCDKARELMQRKNHDYASQDPFDNFYVVEALRITSAEEGILVRMSDKLARLASVLKKGSQVDESVEDTVLDLVNYSVLLQAVRSDRR